MSASIVTFFNIIISIQTRFKYHVFLASRRRKVLKSLWMREIAEIQKEDPSYSKVGDNPVYAKGYKDLHSMTLAYFGHDKSNDVGIPANKYALIAMILYVLAMIVMAFHLWHGFASAFQSLGLKNKKYTPLISGFGKVFSVLVPLAFAIIPIIIFLTK